MKKYQRYVNFRNVLIFLFAIILAIIFLWFALPFLPKFSFWYIILSAALIWFTVEVKINFREKKRIRKALFLGMLLVMFDWFIDYNGLVTGLYTISSQHSLFFIFADPIELSLLALFGGAAWFLFWPKKFNWRYTAVDILVFSSLGTMTEIILNYHGIMRYLSVSSFNAFFTYMLTWIIFHTLNYKIFKD